MMLLLFWIYGHTVKGKYIIILQVERDTNNLGRIYEREEEKLFGFDEEE
ncbi:hypothetical protein [Rummeliibacillus stabekisii]|nr:hypothetical protein [Rummeliibacillus stabekisii]